MGMQRERERSMNNREKIGERTGERGREREREKQE